MEEVGSMTRRKWAALLSALMILCGMVGFATLPAEAAKDPGVAYEWGLKPDGSIVGLNAAAKAKAASFSAQTLGTCTWAPNGKCYWYGNGQYDHRSICFQNALGVYWNYQQAQLGYQSGTNTVMFFNHGQNSGGGNDCIDDWEPQNILYYQAYSGTDGLCAKLSNHVDALGLYDKESFISMNANPPSGCIDTAQHRNRNVSRIIGMAIGLAKFTSSTNLTASIMNLYFGGYNWPGVDDRNALYYLYDGFFA